jgi:hypothetical protein
MNLCFSTQAMFMPTQERDPIPNWISCRVRFLAILRARDTTVVRSLLVSLMDSSSFSFDGIHCKKGYQFCRMATPKKGHLTLFGKNSSAFSPKISFERFMERGLMPECTPLGRQYRPQLKSLFGNKKDADACFL